MKKIIIFVIAFISIFGVCLFSNAPNTTVSANTNIEESINYSDYERIYKDSNGKWHGVIEVERKYYIYASGHYSPIGGSLIHLDFNRDIKQLTTITYKATLKSSGTKIEETIYDLETMNKSMIEMQYTTKKAILKSSLIKDGYEYDYVIFDHRELKDIDIVEFSYILTDEEVDEVNKLIQEQFDTEVSRIINNANYDDYTRKQLINQLIEEYKNYVIEYDEELISDCVGDCSGELIYNEPSLFDWLGFTDDFNLFKMFSLSSFKQLGEMFQLIIVGLIVVIGLIIISQLKPVFEFVFSKYGLIVGVVVVIGYFYYQI